MRLTDLLGHGVGLLRRAGHQAGRHRDASLFQQPDAHVLVQGEAPLLLLLKLGHMASEQTCRTTQNLDEQEEQEQEVTSVLHKPERCHICGYYGNSFILQQYIIYKILGCKFPTFPLTIEHINNQ